MSGFAVAGRRLWRRFACADGSYWAYSEVLLKGKPAERRGRKATGLQQRAMTAGLPAKRKFFRSGVSWSLESRHDGSSWPGTTAETDGLARALL